ncbi:hypothetical protein BJ508DRAFT_321413 [Ascobolus immersus RN42]|uniref:MYND-type domain-containing protein n=1 Tax=Ascobolus immersus RN42 TaxID=1160509 RepID=A0A3N4IL13_ASCIM|nr:hypothetical protein BJ508DRAFT_321413 [Ascobolus immersus RN42]
MYSRIQAMLFNNLKRTSLKVTHPVSSLRNEITFPSFGNVENGFNFGLDFDGLDIRGMDTHRAYIGEIKEDTSFVRRTLEVADRTGERILVAFHDNSRGGYLKEQCKVGNTLLILYPEGHLFADGSIGFRIENEKINHVKVFPHSYERLLAANDLYFKSINRPATCSLQVCSTTSDPAKVNVATDGQFVLCKDCKVAQYCQKECQVTDWNNGHKAICKAVKDVQWITGKEWGKIDLNKATGRPVLYKQEYSMAGVTPFYGAVGDRLVVMN